MRTACRHPSGLAAKAFAPASCFPSSLPRVTFSQTCKVCEKVRLIPAVGRRLARASRVLSSRTVATLSDRFRARSLQMSSIKTALPEHAAPALHEIERGSGASQMPQMWLYEGSVGGCQPRFSERLPFESPCRTLTVH